MLVNHLPTELKEIQNFNKRHMGYITHLNNSKLEQIYGYTGTLVLN